MSRALILADNGDGHYQIQITPDNTSIEVQIIKLTEEISDLAADILAKEQEYDDAQNVVDAKAAIVDAAIDALNAAYAAGDDNLEDETKAVTEATTELAKAASERDKEKAAWEALKLKRTEKEKRSALLYNRKLDDEVANAWCADLTEELSGVVGIIELDGQTKRSRIIQPGYGGSAVYDASRDGCLIGPYGNTGAGNFVNWALKAAWQKWRPTYKTGIISNLDKDANTCTVAIDQAWSDVQSGLSTRYQASYDDVLIDYMSCNARAFENGDAVVVEFEQQDPESPIVIGFMDNPKPCLQHATFNNFSYVKSTSAASCNATTSDALLAAWWDASPLKTPEASGVAIVTTDGVLGALPLSTVYYDYNGWDMLATRLVTDGPVTHNRMFAYKVPSGVGGFQTWMFWRTYGPTTPGVDYDVPPVQFEISAGGSPLATFTLSPDVDVFFGKDEGSFVQTVANAGGYCLQPADGDPYWIVTGTPIC